MTDLKFTSPSGETTIKVQDTGRLGTVAPKTQLHIKMDEPVQYETPMTEIEEVKAQIKVLQSKLSFLEELEKTKSPVEECYKDWWGQYPELETDSQYDDTRWQGFQAGYEFAYAISTAKEVMEKVQEEPEDNEWKSVALRFGEKLSGYLSDGYYELSPAAWFRWAVFTYGKGQQIKDAARDSVKWCEEHPDKDPLDWLKPQTPEQVADGLKEAFREAVKQGVVSSATKPQNLTDLIYDWWEDVFTTNSDWDMEASIDNLVDEISLWLPTEHDTNSYKSNQCIRMIREKLR